MNVKHTPGPWGWIRNLRERRDCNARLIAAAPDLLNALMVAVIHLEDIAAGRATKASDYDMAYINAAIAKAIPK